MSDAYTDRIERFLSEIGAEWQWSRTNGDHRRLTIEHNGKRHIQIVPMTPSEARGSLNAVQDIRHGLGLVGGKRVGDRRARKVKKTAVAPAQMPVISVGRDAFYAPLAELADAMTVPEIPTPGPRAVLVLTMFA
jgi:hypothetical protein